MTSNLMTESVSINKDGALSKMNKEQVLSNKSLISSLPN